MGGFFSTLIPWANVWNALVLALDIIVVILFSQCYKKTKSRNLLTSMPALFTSLGILGTFCSICSSMAGISAEAAETTSNIGKTIGEATVNSLDLKRIIADLIPAFSTSIYGLIFAFVSTLFTKLCFAKEDYELSQSLKYKDPERALEGLDEHVTLMTQAINKETEVNKDNNKKLTESIAAQSQILDKFVDKFVTEMQECFKAMNSVIEERITTFGTTQFSQSRELLESLTKKLGEEAENIFTSHKDSIKTLAEASTAELTEIRNSLKIAVDSLKTDTVSGIEDLTSRQIAVLQRLSDNTLAAQQTSIERQSDFNAELLHRMSSSLSEVCSHIISSIEHQIGLIHAALATSVAQLHDAYEFITEKSSSIVSNYEQASEAYQDAVQNAHDLNERVEKVLREVGEGLKSLSKTNENLDKAIALVESKEANMEAIIMRIEELGKAIVTLQQIESVLSRIAAK